MISMELLRFARSPTGPLLANPVEYVKLRAGGARQRGKTCAIAFETAQTNNGPLQVEIVPSLSLNITDNRAHVKLETPRLADIPGKHPEPTDRLE